jgi:hypothetical protein
MDRHFGSREVRSQGQGLEAAGDKVKLVGFLAVLAVVNLGVERFRGYGLSGIEMLIGALAIAVAIWAYGCVRVHWDARHEFVETEGKDDGS